MTMLTPAPARARRTQVSERKLVAGPTRARAQTTTPLDDRPKRSEFMGARIRTTPLPPPADDHDAAAAAAAACPLARSYAARCCLLPSVCVPCALVQSDKKAGRRASERSTASVERLCSPSSAVFWRSRNGRRQRRRRWRRQRRRQWRQWRRRWRAGSDDGRTHVVFALSARRRNARRCRGLQMPARRRCRRRRHRRRRHRCRRRCRRHRPALTRSLVARPLVCSPLAAPRQAACGEHTRRRVASKASKATRARARARARTRTFACASQRKKRAKTQRTTAKGSLRRFAKSCRVVVDAGRR